ncbi:hypothetical protein BG015_004273, partial [Linnemannia schmuckeri]
MAKVFKIPGLMDLIKNPFLLTLALEALPLVALENEDLSRVQITRLVLYNKFMEQWLEVNKQRLEKADLSREARRALTDLQDDGFVASGVTFMKSLADAVFTHQAGNPFGVPPSPSVDHALNKRSLVQETSILQFLSELVQQDTMFEDQLHQFLELSKTDAQVSKAATNAMTILVKAGVRFKGKDLHGIRIPGADLTGGQFDSASLKGADLSRTNLARAWLQYADLDGAQLTGSIFGELEFIASAFAVGDQCSFTPDGAMLGICSVTGDLYIYDAASWVLLYRIEP